MINYTVPFMGNTSDDMHCLQASYAMIRQYFDPDLEINWAEWCTLTGYVVNTRKWTSEETAWFVEYGYNPEKVGTGTWSNAGLMWFHQNGYDVAHIGLFDYAEFARSGAKYILQVLGDTVGRWDAAFIPDMEAEKDRTRRFCELGIWQKRTPTIDDIYTYLSAGYLIKCVVNLNALNGKPGYLGHAVVVKGYTDTELILHDPGLPAQADRHVKIMDFQHAWGSASPYSLKLDAIKKTSPSQMHAATATDAQLTNGIVPAVV